MFRRLLPRLIIGLICAAAIGAIVLFGVARFGVVSGEEFSPDTFQRRTYLYYELPLVRWKITPVFRSVQPTQLEKLLVKRKYVGPKTPAKRWDLVFARRSEEPWLQGDALILCDYLDAYDAENNMVSFWETWTSDHPQLAKILWPEVVSLARENRYYLIPPLFELTHEYDQPQRLQEGINQALADQYDLLGATELESGDLEAAIDCYSKALQHQPGRRSSLEGRADCYEQLGDADKARQDRAAIDRPASQQAEKEGT